MADMESGQNQSDLLSRLVEAAGDKEGAREIERLKSHITMSEAFSGVKFTSADWEVKLTGTCKSAWCTVLQITM
jgi:hypothetical protein